MSVRAKFKVQSKRDYIGWGYRKDGSTGDVKLTEVTLTPASGEANKEWSEATPCGEIKMSITNPGAVEALKLGEEYFVDFTPAG